MVLDTYNPNINELTEEQRLIIKSIFGNFTDKKTGYSTLKPQVCVYYDAWINDNDTDPILSLTNEIIQSTASEYSFDNNLDLKKVIDLASPIVDFFTGFKSDSLVKLCKI